MKTNFLHGLVVELQIGGREKIIQYSINAHEGGEPVYKLS